MNVEHQLQLLHAITGHADFAPESIDGPVYAEAVWQGTPIWQETPFFARLMHHAHELGFTPDFSPYHKKLSLLENTILTDRARELQAMKISLPFVPSMLFLHFQKHPEWKLRLQWEGSSYQCFNLTTEQGSLMGNKNSGNVWETAWKGELPLDAWHKLGFHPPAECVELAFPEPLQKFLDIPLCRHEA